MGIERLRRENLPAWLGPATAATYLAGAIVAVLAGHRAMLTAIAVLACLSWLMDEVALNAMRDRRRATPLCDAMFPDLTAEQVTALAESLRAAGVAAEDLWAVFGTRR